MARRGRGGGGERWRGGGKPTTLAAPPLLHPLSPSRSLFQARLGKPHLHTRHAKLGAAACTLAVAAPLLGLVSFRSAGLLRRLPDSWHVPIKAAHRVAGAAALAAALAAAFVGVGHPAVARPWLTPAWRVALVVLAIAGTGLGWQPVGRAVEACFERAAVAVGVLGPPNKVV